MRSPAGQASTASAIWPTVWRRTGRPHSGQCGVPARAHSSRRKSYTSVTVPTVERGLRLVVRCSMATEGERPSIWSTSGFSITPRNCRA